MLSHIYFLQIIKWIKIFSTSEYNNISVLKYIRRVKRLDILVGKTASESESEIVVEKCSLLVWVLSSCEGKRQRRGIGLKSETASTR